MIALIGLIIGVILGVAFNLNFPLRLSPYISVAIFACIDSTFGAIRASLNKDFRSDIFVSGFFGNAFLAAGMVYLGDKLGIPVYIAAIIIFGQRIFTNFAVVRRMLMERIKIHH
ncbi:MAG: DUF1290 domain-containing protein [Clostridium sp.]|uniref:small basic family protein n=1 Tax=Clostridium sp. TaxID=1506 RepID=UPI003052E65B